MSINEQGKENAISVQDVTKVYRLYDKPIDRLKESMVFVPAGPQQKLKKTS